MSYDAKSFDRGNRDNPDDPIVRRVISRAQAKAMLFPHPRLLDQPVGMDAATHTLLCFNNPMLTWIPFMHA